jgi:putative ABC transport system permease protein
MIEIIKNMLRRKGRTLLTVFGIGIGILALVVMGAIAEKLNLLVDGGVRYYADKVQVTGAGTSFMAVPLQMSKKDEIAKIDGVKYVAPMVYTTLKKDLDSVNFGPPASINASDLEADKYESFKLSLVKGRQLQLGDKAKVVVGYDLVKKLNAEVGKEVTIRDQKFEVVGILDKTFSTPDTSVSIPLEDGQAIAYEELPAIAKANMKPEGIVSGFIVYPKDGVDPNELAKKIDAQVKDVKSTGPKQFQEQIANAVKMFSSIIFGIGLISLLVGTLSIVNTMTMSISERTKEIGVKKAIGAKPKTIMAEYLTEAGLIGFFGGLIGLGFGSLLVTVINTYMEKSGDKIFLLTPKLLIGSLVFSVVIGILAGIYPAYYAVKINIVKALREE